MTEIYNIMQNKSQMIINNKNEYE